MSDEEHSNEPKGIHLHQYAWAAVGVAGLCLIVIGMGIEGGASFSLGKMIGDAGIGLLSGAVATILLFEIQRSLPGSMKGVVLVFAGDRQSSVKKYIDQNKRIRRSLDLLSVSGTNALKDLLNDKSPLFLAFQRGAKIRILVVDPTSEAAKQKARADHSEAGGRAAIRKGFELIAQIHEYLKKRYDSGFRPGAQAKLEIRITASDPFLTIYSRDSDVIIFGHYFSKKRGDECAAMLVRAKDNADLHRQYDEHFIAEWQKAERDGDREYMLRATAEDIDFHADFYGRKLALC